MIFNNFIGDAVRGVPFLNRFSRYAAETNWSNGEVVTRGTGANYGKYVCFNELISVNILS
jgi:hypothetical protein